VKGPGIGGERLTVHETRAGLGEFAFFGVREFPKEVFSNDEIENRIPQELKTLIGAGILGESLEIGAVNERAREILRVPDGIAQERAQPSNLWFRKKLGRMTFSPARPSGLDQSKQKIKRPHHPFIPFSL
jgi:hypothetical protein